MGSGANAEAAKANSAPFASKKGSASRDPRLQGNKSVGRPENAPTKQRKARKGGAKVVNGNATIHGERL